MLPSPKRTTPVWSHTAVACMADGQPSALGTGRQPPRQRNICGATGRARTVLAARPHVISDELRTFWEETEQRRQLENGGTIFAVNKCHRRHDRMSKEPVNRILTGIYLTSLRVTANPAATLVPVSELIVAMRSLLSSSHPRWDSSFWEAASP